MTSATQRELVAGGSVAVAFAQEQRPVSLAFAWQYVDLAQHPHGGNSCLETGEPCLKEP